MHIRSLVIAIVALQAGTALAARPMAPNDIKATFFNGQPFAAASLGGTKFAMTFTADGKMTRKDPAQSDKISIGIWKLDATGFCTSWEGAKFNCFTIVPSGQNKWFVQKTGTTISTTIAVWSK